MCVVTVSSRVSHAPQWFMAPDPSSSSGGASWARARRRIASSRRSRAPESRAEEKVRWLTLSAASSGTVTTSGTTAEASSRFSIGRSIDSMRAETKGSGWSWP